MHIRMLPILTALSVVGSPSSPGKAARSSLSSREQLFLDASNIGGVGNLIHPWLSDYDLLMHTLRRRLSKETNRGSVVALTVLSQVKALHSFKISLYREELPQFQFRCV